MTSDVHVSDMPSSMRQKNTSLVKEGEPHLAKMLTVAGEPVIKIYTSERGIPLMCQEPWVSLKKPLVTVENYTKWYGIYILHHDGRVEVADPGLLNELERKVGNCLIGDHCYHPRLLNELAKHIGGEVDERSLEVAAGRWWIEVLDGEMEGQPDIHLPYGDD